MSVRAVLLAALVIAVSGVAVTWGRLAAVQVSSLEAGMAAASEGRDGRAIASLRRAVRAHYPLSSRTDETLSELLALGASLEERCEIAQAKLAYRSAVGGANASAVFGPSRHPLAEEAAVRLARLRGEPLPVSQIAARPLGKLATAAGLALSIVAGLRLLLGGSGAAGRRRALLDLSLFLAGLALFFAGALHA